MAPRTSSKTRFWMPHEKLTVIFPSRIFAFKLFRIPSGHFRLGAGPPDREREMERTLLRRGNLLAVQPFQDGGLVIGKEFPHGVQSQKTLEEIIFEDLQPVLAPHILLGQRKTGQVYLSLRDSVGHQSSFDLGAGRKIFQP